MKDKNKDQSVPANLYDLRSHLEFAHAVGVAMWNNCPTAEWRSWKYVPENVKKVVMDELLVIDEVDGGDVEGRLQAVVL
ncbi:hypothetical protein D8674_039548 [Pyrus ussuriensis x Pyrus communis]|uniref:Uncharacterized protein n=1 Tax=Pyrus ussuriensis x Pyrus communis TaxID=2448454 RepID=A0A5N5H602_9ROSA|nr:hypothetical protein D8674_039548 [Pyrus ussuriensis x Pyrus communis]